MKRILSIILILILCLGVLASCQPSNEPNTPAGPSYDLANAKSYLKTVHPELYPAKPDEVPETKADFNLLKVLNLRDGTYTINWTVDNEAIQIVDYVPSDENDIFAGKKVTVKVPTNVSEDLIYTLTATIIAPDESSLKVEHSLKVPGPVVVDGKATLDLVGSANIISASSTQNVYAANGITVTNDQATSTTPLTTQDSYAQRFFKGTTIKVEFKGMRKIVITMDDYNNSQYIKGFEGMTVEGATFYRDGGVLTIVFDKAVDVFQSTALASQVRIKTIEVYLELDGTEGNGGNGGNGGDDPVVTPTYTAPEVDKAYKFYLEQKTLSKNYYFTGSVTDDGKDYFTTSENLADAVDIFFETADGGYNIYFMKDGNKTYFDVAPYLDGSYIKCQFALSTEVPAVVWTFDTTYGVLKVEVTFEGQTDEFFAGNYNSNTPIRLSGVYYIDQLVTTTTQHAARLVLSENATDTPVNPPVVTPPAANPDALTSLKTGDKVYIVAPTYNMALSADKVSAGSYYNKGVDVSSGFGSLTDAETWVVTVNEDGSYTFTSVTGSVLALADSYSSFNDQGNNKTWILEEQATGIYYVKNVGRELYVEWYEEKGNWSAYAPASSALFELSFYAADSTGTVTPPVDGGEDPVDPPVSGGESTNGLVVGQGYKVTANNADGALWLKSTITDGRFDCSTNEADGIIVYIEEVSGGYALYFMNGSAKTYINMADKAAGGSHTTDAASATVYEWNATLNTLVVADDGNNRAFGAGQTSTYTNFSAYDSSNTGYNWGQFIPVE